MTSQNFVGNDLFVGLSRQKFRKYYQPTRILLGIAPAPLESGVNIITLCFSMSCSYKPPMMAISVQKPYYSNELFKQTDEFVLAVPGEALAKQTMLFGTKSGRDLDKVMKSGVNLMSSKCVKVPSLREAIANLECQKVAELETGDHTLFVGKILRFNVDKNKQERCLLSVGPDYGGYKLLANRGIHRLAVIDE